MTATDTYVIASRWLDKPEDRQKYADLLHDALQGGNASDARLATCPPREIGERYVTRVVADPDGVRELRAKLPENAIIELENRRSFHLLTPRPPVLQPDDFQPQLATVAEGTPAGQTVAIRVLNGAQPLAGVGIALTLLDGGGQLTSIGGKTDAAGNVSFSVPSGSVAKTVYAIPRDYWSMTAAAPASESLILQCPPLPSSGPLGWWHNVLGIDQVDLTSGRGVKVGIIDTGVGPTPCIPGLVVCESLVDGTVGSDGTDVSDHGTTTCGIIAAQSPAPYIGISPGVSVYAIRTYPPAGVSASSADVAQAIDRLANVHQVDIINLSLYSDAPSELENDAIHAAAEKGVLCIACSGNDGGNVAWPAANPDALAIAALGLLNWAPPNSIAATFNPTDPSRIGEDGLFSPGFSNGGSLLFCAAPGTAIVAVAPGNIASTIDQTGTSAAAPMVTGVMARLLARDAELRNMPRSGSRTKKMREVLAAHLRELRLPARWIGGGTPTVGR